MDPRLETLASFVVAGMHYRGRNEQEEIPELWRAFWPRHADNDNRLQPGVSYGVIYDFEEGSGVFNYLAGLPISEGGELPDDMLAVTIPGGTYVTFECTLPTLMETNRFIHEEWFPGSG